MSVLEERPVEDREARRGPAGPPARPPFLLLAALSLAAWAVALYSRAGLATPSFSWGLALLGAIAVLDLAAPAWLFLGWGALRTRRRSTDGRAGVTSRLRRSPGQLLGIAALAVASYAGVTLATRFHDLLEPLTFPSLGPVWTFGLVIASVTVAITATTALVLVWSLAQRSIDGTRVDHAAGRFWIAARGPRAGLSAIVAITAAFSVLIQDPGANESSHYALVRSVADGTPIIDRYQRETSDEAYYAGHFYSVKAPGLTFLSLPVYEALDATDVRSALEAASGREAVIRVLSLWAVTLPAGLLMLMVSHLANRVAPGYGTAAAVTLGLATLFMPYSMMLYSHVLAACLAFGAFALLWHERDRAPSAPGVATVAAAGLLAGLAVTTEYALALAGVVLGVYAISRKTRWLRRGLAYSAGAIAGVVPLLFYNWWAFGSITHLSYGDVVASPGRTGHDVTGLHDVGFYGVSPPDLGVTVDLLFSPRGLLVCAPVLVAGVAGLWFLYKRGWRAEALVVGSIALIFLAYNSGYLNPYGGHAPGPRFLVAILPFLAVPLAVAYEKFTAVTLGLAVASATLMGIVTVTGPDAIAESSDPGVWLELLTSGTFQESVASGAGTGWASLIPFAVFVAAAIFFASRATDWSRLSSGLKPGVAALIAWAVIAAVAQAGNSGDVTRALELVGICLATALIALSAAVRASSKREAD